MFDRSLTYQFALFLDPTSFNMAGDELRRLPSIMSERIDGRRTLGLQLGEPEEGRQISIGDGQTMTTPEVVWRAGSGIWQLALRPDRLDLHFDAHGYAEVLADVPDSSAVTLADVRERVEGHLQRAASELALSVKRMGLVVTGQMSRNDRAQATVPIARMFFCEKVREAAARGEYIDLTGRTNRPVKWSLPSDRETDSLTEVNCIEAGSGRWNVRGRQEDLSIVWAFDVNTSALSAIDTEFAADAIPRFLSQAEEWISGKISDLKDLLDA